MVIAHVITRLLRAGSEENTIATCLAQAQAGHRTLLIHGEEWNPLHRDRCGASVELVQIPDLVHRVSPRKDISATLAMRALFKKVRPTVVHTHQSKAGILGRVAARMAGVPYIVHGVHIVPFVGVGRVEKTVYLCAERATARFTSAFINVSQGTRDLCLDHQVGRPEQHFVAPSGMDLSRFRNAPWPEDWRKLLGVPIDAPRPPTVLMLAALERRKRQLEFLDVFGRVVERVPGVRLLLAGEGPVREEVEARIAQRGLGSHVRLLGFHAQPEQLIALADLVVLTSMREGLPRVFVQSLAGGTPIVTTDLQGIHGLIRNGENGVITPADDLTATADMISELLTTPDRLARLRQKAVATDVSAWEVDSMCSQIAGIYAHIIGPQVRAVAG